jgi:hypothetical protein
MLIADESLVFTGSWRGRTCHTELLPEVREIAGFTEAGKK